MHPVNPTYFAAQFSSEFPVSFPTVVLGFIHFGPAAGHDNQHRHEKIWRVKSEASTF
jgi:hypothetical protein